MSDQYDLSPKTVQKLKENAKRRLELRNEFLMKSTDPFRHGSGEGGYVFDAAIHRFGAMRLSTFEHFKANYKTVRHGMLLIVIPMIGSMWYLNRDRQRQELAYRTGQVAYKDRLFKFI